MRFSRRWRILLRKRSAFSPTDARPLQHPGIRPWRSGSCATFSCGSAESTRRRQEARPLRPPSSRRFPEQPAPLPPGKSKRRKFRAWSVQVPAARDSPLILLETENYFLRRYWITSTPPTSSAIAPAAVEPSISGVAGGSPKTGSAAAITNKMSPKMLRTPISSYSLLPL